MLFVNEGLADDKRRMIVDVLRRSGAQFGYLFGSRARNSAGPHSDIDVAAHWGGALPADWLAVEAALPSKCELLVLDSAAPLLAGRVALQGRLLFDDNPTLRVCWEATTRKIYADEAWRRAQAVVDLKAGIAAHG